MYDYSEIVNERGTIKIKGRHWDGIDRPDYVTIELGGPARAEKIVAALLADIEIAKDYEEGQKIQKRSALLDRKKQIEAELAEIEKQL